MTTIHTPDLPPYPIPRAPKPMCIGKRVALAAVGTLGMAAALGLGATIQAGGAPMSQPGSTVIALGPCFGPHRQPIPCPGPGGTVGGNEGYTGGDYPESPGVIGGSGVSPCVGDEVICRQPD